MVATDELKTMMVGAKDCFWDMRRMEMVEEETDLLDKEKEFRETYRFSFNNHTPVTTDQYRSTFLAGMNSN